MPRVFISYASEEVKLATEIALALKAAGYDIWSDFEQLQPGEGFRKGIEEGLEKSQMAVFVMSANAVKDGCYVLTEMKNAQEKWPSPLGHILTVRLNDVAIEAIDPYLRQANLLQQKGTGEIPSEVVRAVRRMAPSPWPRRVLFFAAGLVAALALLWGSQQLVKDPKVARYAQYLAQLQLLADSARRPLPIADCNSSTARQQSVTLSNSASVRKALEFLRSDSVKAFVPPAKTSLDSTNLRSMNFGGVNLRGVSFRNGCIDSTNFQDASLEGANFSGVSGEGAVFKRARLDSSTFSGARLPGASFFGACLRRSEFGAALLEDVEFRYADIGWTNFSLSRLAYAVGWDRGDSAKSNAFFYKSVGLVRADSALLRAAGAIFGGAEYEDWLDWKEVAPIRPSTISTCQPLPVTPR